MKKIMFNDRFGLTDAVLNGTKTVTRRIVNIKDCSESHKYYNGADWKDEPMQLIVKKEKDVVSCYCALCGNGVSAKNKFIGIPLPYQVGEVVAVYQAMCNVCSGSNLDMRYLEKQYGASWNNKMFVKAELMPHKIEILDVRVERLQDITDEDCIKEGIMADEDDYFFRYDPNGDYIFGTPREAFAELIDKVGKKGTWERNPYVFRNEFKLK